MNEISIITASLVVYHNSKEDIRYVIDSFLGFGNNTVLFVVDNSADNALEELCNDERIIYIFNGANLGFGTAHNIAFKKAYKLNSTYHILLNPDVHFESKIIQNLIDKANSNPSIGLLMPKVEYPDGETQYLCKLLPSPKDLILRRFLPFNNLKNRLRNRYELRFFSYNSEVQIPVLSGCFAFIRTAVLRNVDGFDERFFMYLEDVDLCRRIGKVSRLIYYPKVKITHNYAKGSYINHRLLKYHIRSAVCYFNKWGWFYDSDRSKINHDALERLNYKNL
ncbi:glycosyltransferase family 2 protein [Maribacter sp. CXY002]|uniref:glycosyltransferase family 2 protein n=1 Tax=Maribacter luteocoastalis TaxID=3407671 RepID=UPI003B675A71